MGSEMCIRDSLAALAALATAVFLFQPAFLVALLAQGDAIAARASLGRRDRRRGRTGLGRVLLDGDRDQALGDRRKHAGNLSG
ncbi:hypothetical protein KZ849_28725 [Pseudomonas aeruginosa]|nr:hypothetical protein [Pseudomonas aeruginosa]MBW6096584.1 hypothetical protein [Pseudomonas aeruginosa]